MKITVPFYEQTTDDTCTAASMIMVLKYFGKLYKLDRKCEIKIYEEIKMPNRYNIAIVAKRYGLYPVIITNVRTVESRKWLKSIGKSQREINDMKKIILKSRQRAKRLDIREILVRSINVSDITKILKNGGIPVIEINAKLLNHDEVPHMVVITSVSKNSITLNDPLSKSPRSVSIKLFNKMKDFYGDQILIALFLKT